VWVTDYLNVRSGPSASLPKLTTLKPGQQVERTSRSANNYQQIVLDGRTGWVQAKYLTTDRPSESPVSKPSSETSPASSSPSAEAPSSAGTPSPAASASSVSSTPAVHGAYLTANVNLRTAAGTDQKSLGVLPVDSQLMLRGPGKDGWTPVTAAGASGWVKSEFLSTTKPETVVAARLRPPVASTERPQKTTENADPKQTTADGTTPKTPADPASSSDSDSSGDAGNAIVYASVNVNVRSGAGTGYQKVGRLVQGAYVGTRGAAVNGWTPVSLDGKPGWIKSSLLSSTKPKVTAPSSSSSGSSSRIVYATVNVNVRSGAGTGYRKVGRLVQGAYVGTRGAAVNGWTPVSLDGKPGWIKSSLLSSTKPKITAQKTSSSSGTVISSTPRSYSSVPSYGGVDPWGFYWGQCVSYVAWQVRSNTSHSSFQNIYNGVHFGNANNWASAARSLGITVNNTPTVGSVAWRSSGSAGHVAYVTAVHANGTIDVAEYNFLVREGYDTRSYVNWNSGGSSGFDGFIHF
jgi:uncharacterized protein YgiM (DUF1202 family)